MRTSRKGCANHIPARHACSAPCRRRKTAIAIVSSISNRAKFGDHIPLIRRQDVRGFVERKAIWLLRPLGIDKVREYAEIMEAESKRFYLRAARHSNDAAIRQLLGDLAAEERRHEARAEELESELVPAAVAKDEGEAQRRLFVLQIVQPGLAGLMDGSVSTLAPLFAA